MLGNIGRFKGRQELIDDEFDNFKLLNQSDLMPYSAQIANIEVLFDAFITDPLIRKAVRAKRLQVLIDSPLAQDLRATKDVRIKGKRILDYMSDYVAVQDIYKKILQEYFDNTILNGRKDGKGSLPAPFQLSCSDF